MSKILTIIYLTKRLHDAERAEIALRGIEGKRLTYRRINGQEAYA
jgi:hypothetical protein